MSAHRLRHGAIALIGTTGIAIGAAAADAPLAIPDLTGIEALDFSGHGRLELVIDTTPALEVHATDTDDVEVTRRGRTLRIDVDNDADDDTRFVLHLPSLAAVSVSGAARVDAPRLAGDNVDLVLSGAARLDVAEVDANALDVRQSGASRIHVGGGRAGAQFIELSGASRYDAMDVVSARVDVESSGAGRASINATEQLRIDASGATHIDYTGNPRIEQRISGAASINARD